MRSCIAFVAVVLCLAFFDSVSALEEVWSSKLATAAYSHARTPSFTAGHSTDAEKRYLRAKATYTEGEERAVSVGSTLEKAKFYYWKTMGKRPGDIYQKFFKNVPEADILKNSNYKVWQRYVDWFNKAKKAQIIKNQQNALDARPA